MRYDERITIKLVSSLVPLKAYLTRNLLRILSSLMLCFLVVSFKLRIFNFPSVDEVKIEKYGKPIRKTNEFAGNPLYSFLKL